MVGWHDYHDPVLVCRPNQRRSHTNAGCRVSLEWFTYDVLDWKVGKLLCDGICQLIIGQNQNVFAGNQALHTVERGLQHRAGSTHLEQLLWFDLSTCWPKSSAGSAGHNNCMKHE
jgi:hypothetical protein